MAETITMPDLGLEDGGGELTVWLKEVGDSIEEGEPIAEVEADKVTLEVESSGAGILLEVFVQPGETATAGAPLARVGGAEELADGPVEEGAAPAGAAREREPAGDSANDKSVPAEAAAPAGAEREEAPAGDAAGSESGPGEARAEGRFATPVARRIAGQHSVDLSLVPASGPGGRVLRADVERFLAREQAGGKGRPSPAAREGAAPAAAPAGGEAASPLRRTIAERMVQSKSAIPHFYITGSVVMDAAMALRRQINAALSAEEKVSVNDMVMKAAALALRDFPNLNASYVDGRIVRHAQIHLGAAVAIEGGVLTVVNRETDRRPIAEIASANRAMVGRARAGKARPEDVRGSTFTVSNLGAYDTDHFAAIINPPEAAILAVASARDTAVVEEGQVRVRSVMQMTISADHRVTDGAECALYLQKVRDLLETPIQLLLR